MIWFWFTIANKTLLRKIIASLLIVSLNEKFLHMYFKSLDLKETGLFLNSLFYDMSDTTPHFLNSFEPTLRTGIWIRVITCFPLFHGRKAYCDVSNRHLKAALVVYEWLCQLWKQCVDYRDKDVLTNVS